MPKIINPNKSRNHVTITPDLANESIVDIDRAVIEQLNKKHDAILFRGYAFDLDIFKELIRNLCTHSIPNESGGRTMVDKEYLIQTVNSGTAGFSLHPELSRVPWKPDVCWFACVTPPMSGGETIICDGIKIVDRMPTKVFNAFKDRHLDYTSEITRKELKFWQKNNAPTDFHLENPPADSPFKFKTRLGKIYRTFLVPALHTPMFSENLACGNFLLFARYMHNNKLFPVFEDGSAVPDNLVASVKKISDKITVPVTWQANNVLMLDNTRFLHGRNKIENPDQRHILTYFGYLKFAELGEEEDYEAPWRKKDKFQELFGY